jgi:non-heme chloroperoxidase
MPYLTVGKENSSDIKLYYEDHGQGKPIVLIHGFPLSGTAWEKQLPVLLKEGYRVITYDRRGFGSSTQPVVGYDYDTFAADLDKLMIELDLRGAMLVGHSMGTGEVTRYLSNYGSERVERAVLISSIPPFLMRTSDNPEGLDKSLFDGFQKMIRADRPKFITAFLESFYNYDLTKGKSVSEEAFWASWNLGVSASPIGTHECVSTWLTDFRKDLPRIQVPLLIIHGTADRVLPYEKTSKRVEKLVKGSKLVPVADGPHAIPWTHAELINRELLEFLKMEIAKRPAA